MKPRTGKVPAECLDGVRWSVMCVALVAILSVGCAHSRRADSGVSVLRERSAPKAPAFLSGPIAVLLTNTDGFQGRVVMGIRSSSNRVELASGELMGRGTKLLFVPEGMRAAGKRPHGGGMSFLWDVAGNSGYVLSEALQGYAPMTSNVRFTNVVVQASVGNSGLEKVEGHPCEQAEVVVSSSDGAATTFEVWQATDLKRFPLRISSATNSTLPTLSFSRLRLEAPPPEALLPPDGFTKYDSAEAMMSELMLRQQSMRRRTPDGTGYPEGGGDWGGHHSRGGH